MNIDYSTVIDRLVYDYGFKRSGKHLIRGVCPECGKKELHTHQDTPYSIKCNRINSCGYEEVIKDLYPDLYTEYTKKHPPTEADPLATAKAYLSHARGFDVSKLQGWFEQGMKFDADTNTTTATVKFWLDKENGVFWERLIDYADIFGKKAHFKGEYGGIWWTPPTQVVIDPERPLYMVEGIFDAIALWFAGYQVASLMSSNNYPFKTLNKLDKSTTLVFALDNNAAGIEAAKKYLKRAETDGFEAFACIPNTERDWNDIYNRNGMTGVDGEIDKGLWHGATLMPDTAADTAAVHVAQTRMAYRVFTKNNAYWEARYDHSKLEKMIGDKEDPELLNGYFKRSTWDILRDETFLSQIKSCIRMTKLSNCVVDFQYQQIDQYTEERRYHFSVRYENGSQNTPLDLTGSAISGPNDFNKALLNATQGATFLGGKPHIEHLHLHHWFKRQPKVVKTIDFIGYDKISKAYVFDNVAFIDGRRIERNKQHFYEYRKTAIKSTMSLQDPVEVGTQFDAQDFFTHFQNAFGERGLVALAWWTGALFATQIREKIGYYPFFELCGQASSGKSTMIEIMWKLVGRDHEGFNPFGSSWAGVTRELSQVSNLPIVLMESDANDERGGNARGFNWESLKAAHDGKPLRTQGVKNGGNETKASPFRGALMAAQNNPIQGSEAIITRFIHMRWGKVNHLPGGEFHADHLRSKSTSELSGYLPLMLQKESTFVENVLKRQKQYIELLKTQAISSARIIKNHALVMAILEEMTTLFPINKAIATNALERLVEFGVKRQVSAQADHQSVEEFWDAYEYLNLVKNNPGTMVETLNHSLNPERIAINLVHFEKVCKERGVNPPDKRELKRHLQGNKRNKFIGHKTVRSQLTDKSIVCYLFEAPKEKPNV